MASDSDEPDYVYSDEEDEEEMAEAAADPSAAVQAAGRRAERAEDAPPRSRAMRGDYRILAGAELAEERDAVVGEVAGVLDVDPQCAGVLLRHFRWSRERLFDAYMGAPEATRAAAGLRHLGAAAPPLEPADAAVTCGVCMGEARGDAVFGLGCGHRFCHECWRGYLTVKVGEGPACVFATCPLHGCDEVVVESHFARFLGAEAAEAYEGFLLRSFVDVNRALRWCPAADCGRAALSGGAAGTVRCACGAAFCFRCGEEAHAPISCALLAQWQEKCTDESETANWILSNAKRCPKCKCLVTKNGGCNHMTCSQCKWEYCWICEGPWTEHGAATGGYYKCNKFDPDAAKGGGGSGGGAAGARSEAERAEIELNRYLHYFQRYGNHHNAGKFAERQRAEAETRMAALQSQMGQGSSWIDVQFLRDATETLIECRRVLKYTYAMGFYLEAGPEKELLEYLQENLEKNTEHLADLTEQPLEQVQREEITNYAAVTEQFLNNLLSGIEEGLTSS